MNYTETGKQIGELVQAKNEMYGDAFHQTGKFLEILYPKGIMPHQYKELAGLIRTFDKQMRIANGNKGDENHWNDIAGYGILMSSVNVPKKKKNPIVPFGEEMD